MLAGTDARDAIALATTNRMRHMCAGNGAVTLTCVLRAPGALAKDADMARRCLSLQPRLLSDESELC